MTTVTPNTPRIAQPGKFHDAQEWLRALGDVPLSRVVMDPWPGTATEQDLLVFVERDKRLVELIDGTLVEKPMGWIESMIAIRLAAALLNFVTPRKLGYVSGEAGTLRMAGGRIRLPDVAFVSIDDLPDRKLPREPIPKIPPTLAVEVLSESNTKAEIQQKLKEYFESKTRLAWVIDPESRTVAVYEGPTEGPARTLKESETLDGGAVLPGFTIAIAELFAPID
jgi:Uma2 family endonuclease